MKAQEILANAEAINVSSKKGGKSIKSVSLVFCDNGKRLTLSKSLFEALGKPEFIKLAADVGNGFLIIAPDTDEAGNKYSVSNKGKGIVYNAALVKYITVIFDLDFSERTSMSFDNVKVKSINGIMTAFVKIYQ